MEFGVVAVWWLTYLVLMLASWPLAGWILGDAPDRGVSLAIPLSLVVLGVPTLWVGQVSFDVGILVAVVVLGVLSVVGWRSWLNADNSPRWREFGATLLVFSVAFGFLLLLQAASPGIFPGGGEKFLDFGILQSLLRADRLPPQDVWFAGEHVRYYYGGHLLAAILAKANGTPGVFAYAPALAGYYAMQVTAVYGLAQAIASGRSDLADGRSSSRVGVLVALLAGAIGFWVYGVGASIVLTPTAFGLFAVTRDPARRAGLLGAFAFGFASNLLTPLRLAANRLSPETLSWVMATFGPSRDIDAAVSPESFSYWTASRVIPDTINEFPLFAYRNGDLHAHMMSPALLLLLIGVLLAYARTPAAERTRRVGLLAVTVPIAGMTIPVNTWSFPTVLGLVTLVVAGVAAPPWSLHPRLADWSPPRAVSEVVRVVGGLGVAAVVAAVAVVSVWPFVVNVLVGGPGSQTPALFPTRSGLGPFAIVHGVFLASFAVYLLHRGSGTSRGMAVGLAIFPVLTVVGWQFDLVGLLLVGPLVVAGWWLVRSERAGFETLLVVAGAGLVVLVEFVYLVDNAGPGRFNTVFKVYAQVWAIWSVALGVVLASFTSRVDDWRPNGDWSLDDWRVLARRGIGPFAIVFLVVTTSVYGGLVVQQHVGGADEFSLDGMTYAHTHHPEEAAAIEWLADRPGQPTMVSKPCASIYRWCNPASSLTGIPTLAGWGHHESVYHGADAYSDRLTVVNVLYDTDDPYSRAILLRNYDVDYIYVGPREREAYETIDYAAEPGIEVAFRNDAVVIYRVTHAELTNEPT